MSAAAAPCRAQVRDAKPLIVLIASWLCSDEPVDAQGIARLVVLMRDGAGPFYVRSRSDALTVALLHVANSLAVED
jgi:hypothetical protein